MEDRIRLPHRIGLGAVLSRLDAPGGEGGEAAVGDTPRTWHSVSNVIVEVGSETAASSICYFTVHQELPGLPLQPIVTGRYIDSFERHDGTWRFVLREVEGRLFGDVSKHVAAPAEATAG
ncbi:nuclear transport factor 2 family protein [Methylobacterium sp. CM6241]